MITDTEITANRRFIFLIAGAILILTCGFALAQDPSTPPSPDALANDVTHVVAEDETLEGIAERYLGAASNVPELLKFNAIDNPLIVRPGMRLAIPGRARTDALAGFDGAEASLVSAIQEGAKEFAADELALARDVLAQARSAWRDTAYLKAIALCKLCVMRADDTARLAAERARVRLTVVISSTHGTAYAQNQQDTKWIDAEVGMQIPVTGSVRTGERGQIELTLPDGGTVQVKPQSEVRLSELVKDQRSGDVRTRLEIIVGEILGDFNKLPTKASKLEIQSGAPAIAIRGTQLRVNRKAESARIMVLEGLVAASTDSKSVDVPENEGLLVKKGRLDNPVPLLPAPDIIAPAGQTFRTASQWVNVSWNAVGKREGVAHGRHLGFGHRGRRATSYHFELATDDKFNHVIQSVVTDDSLIQTDVLKPGTYFWHLSSIDKEGLEGAFRETAILEIVRELGVSISTSAEPVAKDGVDVVAPGTSISLGAAASDTSVAAIEYRLNEGDYKTYTKPLELAGHGTVHIEARGQGLDKANGKTIKRTVRVDGEPPFLDVRIGRTTKTRDGRRTVPVTVSADDDTGVDLIEISINGDDYVEYQAPLDLDASENQSLVVRAIDVLGNVSPKRLIQIEAAK